MVKLKAWMGVGISNTYIKILKELPKKISNKDYESITLILADEPDKKYNERDRSKLADDLFNLASKIKIPNVNIKVERWKFLSENKDYQKIKRKVKRKYFLNFLFRKKVNEVVFRNRTHMEQNDLKKRKDYVISEIASINYLSSQGLTKIGPKKQEGIFDQLAKDFPLVKEIKTQTFQ